MYIYIYTYTYIHIYIHTYTYTYNIFPLLPYAPTPSSSPPHIPTHPSHPNTLYSDINTCSIADIIDTRIIELITQLDSKLARPAFCLFFSISIRKSPSSSASLIDTGLRRSLIELFLCNKFLNLARDVEYKGQLNKT